MFIGLYYSLLIVIQINKSFLKENYQYISKDNIFQEKIFHERFTCEDVHDNVNYKGKKRKSSKYYH